LIPQDGNDFSRAPLRAAPIDRGTFRDGKRFIPRRNDFPPRDAPLGHITLRTSRTRSLASTSPIGHISSSARLPCPAPIPCRSIVRISCRRGTCWRAFCSVSSHDRLQPEHRHFPAALPAVTSWLRGSVLSGRVCLSVPMG
jgi:hypothetical protein